MNHFTCLPVQRGCLGFEKSNRRPYQINVMFHGLFTFSGWPSKPGKIKKSYYEMICITKITMIAKTTSVHSQLANSTFLSHTLSYLCSWQQQLLKYLAAHTMNCQPLQLYFHHITMIMWFTFLFEIWKKGLKPDLWNIKLIRYGLSAIIHYVAS